MKISQLLHLPDYFTLLNAVSGLFAIFFAISGDPAKSGIAPFLLFAAVVFDYLDGKIARWTGTTHAFGKELDSLADTVSFGVAPAVLGFVALEKTKLAFLLLAFFVCCGILRLARFNISQATKKGVYEGVPITTNGLVFPLLYLFGAPSFMYLVAYGIMGLLMISNIRIKKMI
ncbi:MAG TPA: CDP-diacylglycerol--serine O-phosphatidyltransferase [Chthoniobacterales bacterium]|nr:CDP-diacylglycerol--serine O-phosphatidyltransferase [Candidatus Woesearchaeota archaeon]HIH47880.1 CDP-diacylglycerol--serine O-phosphatidyltransferase [Candidatus Woesearchaeota archaeon]HII88416.1 CDP-diacylglycerol--serine O-phosphatidyltransferase [Candidatus Woesearchaeota archaeon]HLB33192.1 CDP-diacylglycerol--serine O-phosphatidyltransferase [Chthoniobacterales bacterium]